MEDNNLQPAKSFAFNDERALRGGDIDFARNARRALMRDHVHGANFLLWLIAAGIAGFIFWASRAILDEVTRGNGKVIPSSSVQTMQNLEGGIIDELLVSEGDRVAKGDVLVRIDDTISQATYKENLAKSEALQATLARLKAEAEGQEEIKFDEDILTARADLVKLETELFKKRQSDLAEQTETLKTSISLASDELALTIPLVKKNIVSKVDQMKLEREVNELDGKLKEITGAFRSRSMEQYNETIAKLGSLKEFLAGRQDQVRRTVVRSPVDGTVNHVYIKTLGGVLKPGESILDIVPDDATLLVEAQIRPADIAFIRPGQKTMLKFTAYDFSIFGGLEGRVENISADTILDETDQQHYYQIKVRNQGGKLKDREGDVLPIIPGMVVEVDILTGRRTVLQYLLKPFHRMRFNALRER